MESGKKVLEKISKNKMIQLFFSAASSAPNKH